jgi:serine/threonine protein kinase
VLQHGIQSSRCEYARGGGYEEGQTAQLSYCISGVWLGAAGLARLTALQTSLNVYREVRVLKTLKHKNIVQLKDVMVLEKGTCSSPVPYSAAYLHETPGQGLAHIDLCLVFEYMEYDLYGLLNTEGITLSELHIKAYLHQMLEGIGEVHKHGYIHRDLKGKKELVVEHFF